MNLIRTIKNCREFVLFNDVIGYTDQDFNFTIEGILKLEGKFTFGGTLEDKVILFDNDNFKALFYDFDANLVKTVNDFAIIKRSDIIDGEFVAGINNGESISFALVTVDNFAIKKKLGSLSGINGVYIVVENKYFISKNKTQIGLFDLANQQIWLRSFSEYTDFESSFIGAKMVVVNRKLFFQGGNDIKKGLFSIDVMTGELQAFYHEANAGFLMTDYTKIYTVKHPNVICIIDPANNDYIEWDVGDIIKENDFSGLNEPGCIIHDGKIYFTQNLGADHAKIGVLDVTKRSIVAKYDFLPENGGVKNIVALGSKIYVHTWDFTLHIFEHVV